MDCKKVCLVINPRNGQNMAKIIDLLAVLSAAGWKTDILLKKYCGETMELASEAAKKDYDLIVAYGGDGTLNQVLNGVMNARGRSIVGLITGGTANEWAGEIHIPRDPVKAALTLINSEARRVDLGHVAVQRLIFPQNSLQKISKTHWKETAKKKEKGSSKAPHQFLLMAGLGIDATVIDQTSNTLKHQIGRVAFDLTAAKAISTQQEFPVEIRRGGCSEGDILWQGKAIQVIIETSSVVEMAEDDTGKHKKDSSRAENERLQALERTLEHINVLLDNGRKVTVEAGVPNPHQNRGYIIAGRAARQSTGEMQPVAVRIDDKTTVMNQAGEHLSPVILEKLQEGQAIVVEGKKSKRGVIRATHVIV
ncbi:MAG TPA: diacylglycerol kinase family protein [Ktedonobacteraceae bacterium]|nr:diacylglycerol kinase family protein [Ktedonobacteraceae bacterium]